MKPKILILGSSSFSGASMVNYLLDKNKYKLYGTYRRRKNNSYLPYKFNKNLRLFKEYKIDFKEIIKLFDSDTGKYISSNTHLIRKNKKFLIITSND